MFGLFFIIFGFLVGWIVHRYLVMRAVESYEYDFSPGESPNFDVEIKRPLHHHDFQRR